MTSNKIITIVATMCTCVVYIYISQMNNKMKHMQELLHDQQDTITYQSDVILRLGEYVDFLANEYRTKPSNTQISID